jgi:hypothetical protein
MIFKRSKPVTRRQRLNDEQLQGRLSNYAYNSSPRKEERSERKPPAVKKDINRISFGRYWLAKGGLLILIVAVAASLINVFTLSSSAHVIPLSDSTDKAYLQPTSVYEAAADKVLKKSVWNRSKITVDANGISQSLLKQFPELASVSVTIPLMAHRPLVYIEPTQPSFILAAANGSFVLDSNGKVLSSLNQSNSLNLGLPTITDESNFQPKLKQQALSTADVKFTQIVIAELAAKNYVVSSLVLPAASSELDVHLTGQPYYIKYNLENNDPAQQAGTFLATINNLKKQNITPSQYVDVRVDGRAYYL